MGVAELWKQALCSRSSEAFSRQPIAGDALIMIGREIGLSNDQHQRRKTSIATKKSLRANPPTHKLAKQKNQSEQRQGVSGDRLLDPGGYPQLFETLSSLDRKIAQGDWALAEDGTAYQRMTKSS